MATFKPRFTKPENGNPYYNTKSNGGYSTAIKGKPTDPDCDVLSNCVGYAYGRFNEIGGWGYCKYLVPTNAEKFIQYKGNLEVGQTPKLGACMVWQKGSTLSGNDGAGHVAIVEQIISDTEVITSDSGWGAATPFWTTNRKKGDGNWSAGEGYTFLGFIYNPVECCKEAPPVDEAPTPATPWEPDEGDIVLFKGGNQYRSANATTGSFAAAGPAKITKIAYGKKHPYHLVKVSGEGSTVYGWVDAANIESMNVEHVKPWVPTEGDIVTFNGGVQYRSANALLGSKVSAGQAKITRYVPGKRHPYHLVRTGKTGPYGWVNAGTFTKA